jgi:hypothetical protein
VARRAASSVTWPVPQPTSRTWSSGAIAAVRKRLSLKAPTMALYRARWRAQCTPSQPFQASALAAPVAEAQLRLHVRGTREILGRVAPIVEMLRAAAAADPALAGQWDDGDPRFTVHLEAARALVAKPGARAGVTAEQAADLLFGLLNPELYQVFVRDRGWSAEQWEKWAGDTLAAQLCRRESDS